MSRGLWRVQTPARPTFRGTSLSTVPLTYAGPECQVHMQILPLLPTRMHGGSVTPFYRGENSPREVVPSRRPRRATG